MSNAPHSSPSRRLSELLTFLRGKVVNDFAMDMFQNVQLLVAGEARHVHG